MRFIGLLGVGTMVLLTLAISYDRRSIAWRRVAAGLALQAGLALVMLRTGVGRGLFAHVGTLFEALLRFREQGARFVFGDLVQPELAVGIPGPGGAFDTSAGYVLRTGATFAFGVVPTIIFFSALMSLLYYIGVMNVVMKGIGWVLQRTIRTSGAETIAAAGNIFLGASQVPLLIRPYVARLTPSELVSVMVVSFATASSAVMAVYVVILQPHIPGVAATLIAASVLNAPGGLLLSKVLLPETGTPVTAKSLDVAVERTDSSFLDAIGNGALRGMQLAIGIVAIVIALVSLVALLNAGLGWIGGLVGHPEASLQVIVGQLLRPLIWVMGVPWGDTAYVGGLIGLKVSLVDLVAYKQFASDLAGGLVLDPRTMLITTFALLGFANISTIGIQLGVIGGIAPERRAEVARFGVRAMIVGNLTGFMSASLAGTLA
jgi:CNT family concentrative nucleoside transporter